MFCVFFSPQSAPIAPIVLFFELILIFALVKKCTKLRCCATIILDVIVFTAHDRQTDRPTDRQTDGERISLCNFVATRLKRMPKGSPISGAQCLMIGAAML